MTDECPKCNLAIHTAKSPGLPNRWNHPKVMLNPCTCIVEKDALRRAGP